MEEETDGMVVEVLDGRGIEEMVEEEFNGRGTDGGWKRCSTEEETDGMVEDVLDGRGTDGGGRSVGWKRKQTR